ncbi:MAG: transposase family protein, partial [Bacteroidota bacterium]
MTRLEHSSKVPDFRLRNKHFRHELVDRLALSLPGVLSGAEDLEEIAWFGEQKKDFLGSVSELSIRCSLPRYHSSVLEAHRLLPFESSIDGKVLRGSTQGRHRPLHLVSAGARELGLSLGQYPCTDKSNEITAIPAL